MSAIFSLLFFSLNTANLYRDLPLKKDGTTCAPFNTGINVVKHYI